MKNIKHESLVAVYTHIDNLNNNKINSKTDGSIVPVIDTG